MKKISKGAIILIILAVLCLVWGAKLKSKVNTGATILKDAVYIDDGTVSDENEGKTVVVSGKVKVSEYAYDNNLGLTIESPYAYRKSEYLVLKYEEDEDGKRDYFFEWKEDHDSDSKGQCKDLFGKASLGNFGLDNSILKKFKQKQNYGNFYNEELRYNLWEYVEDPDGKAYMTIAPAEWTENGPDYLNKATRYDKGDAGEYRVSYSYAEVKDDTYTIAGIQKDGKIVVKEGLLNSVFEGKMSIDEISAYLTEREKSNAKIPFIIAGVLLAIAVLVFVKGSKE